MLHQLVITLVGPKVQKIMKIMFGYAEVQGLKEGRCHHQKEMHIHQELLEHHYYHQEEISEQ